MGGLMVATVLTLVFLPTFYVTWFGIKAPTAMAAAEPIATANQPQALAA
jgi:hypothetical protein